MALPFIKSNSDYKRWQEAVQLTKKRAAQRNPEDPNYDPALKPIENVFAYANWLYHNVLNGGGSALVQESEQEGLINSEEQNTIFEAIYKEVFDILKNEDDSKKWQIVENVYKKYCENNKSFNKKTFDEQFVNTGTGYVPGNNNIAGLYGFGGYRDEPPKGPIIYGINGSGISPMSKNNGEPAVVEIPKKVNNYNPLDYQLDTLGNVTSDVEQAQKQQELDTSIEGPVGDIVFTLQDMGYDIDTLQDLSDEELQNLMIKALKRQQKETEDSNIQTGVSKGKTVAQQLTEAFTYEYDEEDELLDEREGPIAKARKLLAAKHRIKKANEKEDGKHYYYNMDDITKLMSKYGYKLDRKTKKWSKKTNQTFKARTLLSQKFNYGDAVKKDENNKYIITQDDILSKIRSKGYEWNPDKKEWLKITPTEPQQSQIVKPVSSDQPIKQEDPLYKQLPPKSEPEPEEIKNPVEKDAEKDYEEPEETDADGPILNPMNDSTIAIKLKLMQARFILGVANNFSEATTFIENEEQQLIPSVTDDIILEKIATSGYEWNPDTKLWLNHALTLPNAIFEHDENTKTVIARSYLAAIDKVKNIKVKPSGQPSSDPKLLDKKMEHEGFLWDINLNKWKYFGEGEEISQEPMNESVDNIQEAEKFSDPKHPYKLQDVSDAQAKMLYRALQLELFRKKYGKQPSGQQLAAWTAKYKDGGANDPINGKLDIHKVEKGLDSLGYSFNDNEDSPMWVLGNEDDVPGVLKLYGIDKQEYIARGILGSKDPKQISIQSQNGINPRFNENKPRILRSMKDAGIQWNEDWGWIKSDTKGTVLSKSEKEHQDWLKTREHVPYESLGKEKDSYKEKSAYRIASRYADVSPSEWNNLTPQERKKAIKKMQLHYQFDTNTKQWKMREKPINNNFMNRIGKLLGKFSKGAAVLGGALGKGLKTVVQDPGISNLNIHRGNK